MRKRYWLYGFLAVTLTAAIVWQELLVYGIRAGIGQLNIVWNSKPVAEVISDPATPDSVRRKLSVIERVRRYAIDSLGLKDTDNYSTYFDQQGKELLWVVTACEPYRLKEKTWDFPVVGSVPYKGFFDSTAAVEEGRALKEKGFDISIRNPGGWSTLGWFRDPVLSGMLDRSDGDLASLIIHEMSHATIYVKDSSDFNENLASFIGDAGAREFLRHAYGPGSSELEEFVREDKDYRRRAGHLLRGASKLDSLYNAISNKPDSEKQSEKETMIRKIIEAMDTLLAPGQPPYRPEKLPNNTLFMSFLRYQGRQSGLEIHCNRAFGGDIRKMIEHYRKRYPFL